MVIAHLLVEGVPVGHIPSVGETNHENGQTGLAEEHIPDQLRPGLDVPLGCHVAAALPEPVPVDEEVPVGGSIAVFQNVLELPGEYRGMVQNEVQGQVNVLSLQPLQILPAGQKLVEVVVDEGKTPIQVGIEHAGENVKGGEGAPEFRALQQLHGIGQPGANAVGVGVEHGAQSIFCHDYPSSESIMARYWL